MGDGLNATPSSRAPIASSSPRQVDATSSLCKDRAARAGGIDPFRWTTAENPSSRARRGTFSLSLFLSLSPSLSLSLSLSPSLSLSLSLSLSCSLSLSLPPFPPSRCLRSSPSSSFSLHGTSIRDAIARAHLHVNLRARQRGDITAKQSCRHRTAPMPSPRTFGLRLGAAAAAAAATATPGGSDALRCACCGCCC